jgi:hypothetical protein
LFKAKVATSAPKPSAVSQNLLAMAALFPLGLGLPSRQTIFMLTPPFHPAVSFNPKSAVRNPKSLSSQFLFHRLHLGRDSILTLFPVVTLNGKIHPVTVLA